MDNFINNLREIIGRAQKEAANIAAKQKQQKAINGSLRIVPDQKKLEAARRGTTLNYPRYNEMLSLDIAENKDKLDRIIDQYESAPSNDDRLKLLMTEYSKIKKPTLGIQNWFNDFSTMTNDLIRGNAGWAENDVDVIIDAMRERNKDAFNKYFRNLS